jgi:hypothetical protein
MNQILQGEIIEELEKNPLELGVDEFDVNLFFSFSDLF